MINYQHDLSLTGKIVPQKWVVEIDIREGGKDTLLYRGTPLPRPHVTWPESSNLGAAWPL